MNTGDIPSWQFMRDLADRITRCNNGLVTPADASILRSLADLAEARANAPVLEPVSAPAPVLDQDPDLAALFADGPDPEDEAYARGFRNGIRAARDFVSCWSKDVAKKLGKCLEGLQE